MNNISDISQTKCTGCGACSAICPVSAVNLELNVTGFLEASIQPDLCISCGKCKQVCIKYQDDTNILKLTDGEMYSVISTDKGVLESCTSGGIAHEIAAYGITKGYKIIGVAYNYDKNRAEAVMIENLKDLEKLKGSKYIQANTMPCYRDLLDRAEVYLNERYIVFGTPCQVYGIKKAFTERKLDDRVVAIDLFCHGVPSNLLWRKYLQWLELKEKIVTITQVKFRSKKAGWHDFTMEIKSGKTLYSRSSEYDLFYKAFFDNVMLNPACFKCNVRKNVTMADLRLGDFWGKRYQNNDTGVSAVLVLSEKGGVFLEELKKHGKVSQIEKVSVEECVTNQSVHDYCFQDISEYALSLLQSDKELDEIIKLYRRKMPFKYNLKLYLKEATAYMPDKFRKKIRNIYQNLR